MSSNHTTVDTLANWIEVYRYAKDNAAKWNETADEARAKITAHLDEHDAEIGTVDGQPAVKYTPVTTRRFDSKAFRHDHPEMAAHYITEQTTRRFTVVDG